MRMFYLSSLRYFHVLQVAVRGQCVVGFDLIMGILYFLVNNIYCQWTPVGVVMHRMHVICMSMLTPEH